MPQVTKITDENNEFCRHFHHSHRYHHRHRWRRKKRNQPSYLIFSIFQSMLNNRLFMNLISLSLIISITNSSSPLIPTNWTNATITSTTTADITHPIHRRNDGDVIMTDQSNLMYFKTNLPGVGVRIPGYVPPKSTITTPAPETSTSPPRFGFFSRLMGLSSSSSSTSSQSVDKDNNSSSGGGTSSSSSTTSQQLPQPQALSSSQSQGRRAQFGYAGPGSQMFQSLFGGNGDNGINGIQLDGIISDSSQSGTAGGQAVVQPAFVPMPTLPGLDLEIDAVGLGGVPPGIRIDSKNGRPVIDIVPQGITGQSLDTISFDSNGPFGKVTGKVLSDDEAVQLLGHRGVATTTNFNNKRIVRNQPSKIGKQRQVVRPSTGGDEGAVGVKKPSQTVTFNSQQQSDDQPTDADDNNNNEGEEEKWGKRYPTCDGPNQSPININPRAIVDDPSLSLDFLPSYNHRLSEVTIHNDGYTLDAQYVSGNRPAVTGSAAYDDIFLFEKLHFHWGSKNTIGSEHSIFGQKFPVEMHLVHYNDKYRSFTEASDRPDGLLVVAVFFQVTAADNPRLDRLFNMTNQVRCSGQSIKLIDSLQLSSFLPINRTEFYRYQGSLTTPPCYESVTWIILKRGLLMGRNQLKKLRDLRTGSNCDIPITNNWRNLQKSNGRKTSRALGPPYHVSSSTSRSGGATFTVIPMSTFNGGGYLPYGSVGHYGGAGGYVG